MKKEFISHFFSLGLGFTFDERTKVERKLLFTHIIIIIIKYYTTLFFFFL